MSEVKTLQSPSTKSGNPSSWTATQAYLLAVFCLLLGVAVGYLFRGSASPAHATAAAATEPAKALQQQSSAEAQAAFQQAVEPLLEAVKKDPVDYDSLVKLGNMFYDAQQFPDAIQYYERALAIHPENPDVRTDMGTAYWYSGNADKALAAMETSLKYRPGHPQTLFNLGWVKWQGKADPKGAIEAWEKLLKTNPNYPQKQQVEQYIAKAKEHAARG
jgi:cytochrome c-type biogenesis protein CcmH/NrfG